MSEEKLKVYKPISNSNAGNWEHSSIAQDAFETAWEYQQEKIQALQKENGILKEALVFYADTNNWKSGFSLKIDDTKLTETNHLRRGGKRARQALKEIE